MSDQSCDRMFVLRALDHHINRLGTSIFQLSLGLRHVNRRRHSAVVPALRELQRFLERRHVRVEQLLFRIERAHLEIVESEFRVQTQAHRFQIARRWPAHWNAPLRRCGVRVQTRPLRTTHRQGITRSVPFVCVDVGNQGPVLRKMFALRRSARSHRGIVGRTIESHQCPRLPELRFRRLQILIGNIDLLFQRVQLRVLKNLPPLALAI